LSDERPDALLKSALEKIVYFEARSEQLVRDLSSASAEAGRLKQELAAAGQREIEFRRTVASLEVELGRARREREELGRINDALRSERAALIEKMLEASRIHGAVPEDEDTQFDLASFIAQLRSEVLSHSSPPPRPAPAPAFAAVRAPEVRALEVRALEVRVAEKPAWERTAAEPPSARDEAPPSALTLEPTRGTREEHRDSSGDRGDQIVTAHAERFRVEGRLDVSSADVERLAGHSAFPGRVEQTLFGFSVRELSAPDPVARQRAAERLRALGQVASAPALATALHGEREPAVQVALLQAFAEVAPKEGAAVVQPLLDASNAEVRIAALKALLALDPTQAAPHLSAAMRDVDRAVRRRASLMALSLAGDAALALGEQAMRDGDADVRSLGALVLGACAGDRGRSLLLSALRDADKKVRRAAAQSLSHLLGEDVSKVVELDDASRRREVRRLGTLPLTPARRPAAAPPLRQAEVADPGLAPAQAIEAVEVRAGRAPAEVVAIAAARASAEGVALRPVSVPTTATALVAPVEAVPGAPSAPPPQPPEIVVPSPRATELTGAAVEVDATVRTAVAVAPVSTGMISGSRQAPEALCSAVAGELRISLRGRSVAELSAITGETQAAVLDACELLAARGQALRRGNKFFAA
jgi:HEAT repeat protein